MGITCHKIFLQLIAVFISKSSGYLKYKLLIEKNLINDENCVKKYVCNSNFTQLCLKLLIFSFKNLIKIT